MPDRFLNVAGELHICSPAGHELIVTGDANSLALDVRRTRELLNLRRLVRSSRLRAAGNAPLDKLRAFGLGVVTVRVAGHCIAEIGGQGNWIGRILGRRTLRLNPLVALRFF